MTSLDEKDTVAETSPVLEPEAPTLSQDGVSFRDLNKNGRLDPYEDPRRPLDERVEDLLGQMTLEEKAGLMFHTPIAMGDDGTLVETPNAWIQVTTSGCVAGLHINHFNLYDVASPRPMAEWYNRLQKLAERTRLGIPVTVSSDPRHGFGHNRAAAIAAGSFSQWCEPIGFGAVGDEALVREFGDMARQEYLAVGIRVALHPMADLATEPRWARINGTFGEDAEVVSRLVAAYVKGFQGDELGPESVACMTKHFPGGGPQQDGEDPHFSYGAEQAYPGDNFDYHLAPFEAAFEAGTAQIMPYYGKPVGTPLEEVGFGFSKGVITGMLRERYGFDGVVCTDWSLVTDFTVDGHVLIEAKCWGVEDLSVEERVAKVLEAGVDQFGGEASPELVVELVRSGRVAEARIDESARRILRDKFKLGLFDDPYVDPQAAEQTIGKAEFRKAGELAQRRAITLLDKGILPLKGRPRVYVEGIDSGVAGEYGEVVDDVANAEVAIIRLDAPYEPREGFLEQFFRAGSLEFPPDERDRILGLLARVPTIVDIYLDRPAVIPEIAERSAALLADFGASDAAVLDVVFGRCEPSGRLPFELPASMDAVEAQKEDVPYDSEEPLFPFGHGLTY